MCSVDRPRKKLEVESATFLHSQKLCHVRFGGCFHAPVVGEAAYARERRLHAAEANRAEANHACPALLTTIDQMAHGS